MKNQKVIIKEITAIETIAVRRPVLRKGLRIEDCIFEGDDLQDTLHLGLFDNNILVGVVTYMVREHKNFSAINQIQLRGMAVLESCQGKGYGHQLISEGEKLLKIKGGDFIWCNARVAAVPFYIKNDFEIIGDSFDIPIAGLHFLMCKTI